MPLFTFVIAAGIGSERATPERVFGLVVGFAGAAVVIGPDLTDLTSSNTLGQLAVIGGSLGYAASAILARERASGDPWVLSSGQMVVGAAIMTPIALIVDGAPDTGIPAKAALAWAGLGVFSSGFAYIIYFTLIQRVSATSVSLVSYLIPIVAAVLGVVVLDESLGPNLFIGMALIIVGMMAVNGALRALFQRRSPDPSEAIGL
jgi:drug/metabolite transporter (DMT)-like permease